MVSRLFMVEKKLPNKIHEKATRNISYKNSTQNSNIVLMPETHSCRPYVAEPSALSSMFELLERGG